MNEAQLFVFFLSILIFGWVGFFAGRAWEDLYDRRWHFFAIASFMLGSAAIFIAMTLNLAWLLGRNF